MTILRATTHAITGVTIFEIHGDRGELLGALYPVPGTDMVHLASMRELVIKDTHPGLVPVPSKTIKFGPLIDGTGARQQEPSKE